MSYTEFIRTHSHCFSSYLSFLTAKSFQSCLSPGDRVYDNYSMLKEISGNYGDAKGAEHYAIRYCKDTYGNECDIIVKIVRDDAYEGSFIKLIF